MNGIRTDNRPDNLFICPREKHASFTFIRELVKENIDLRSKLGLPRKW